MTRNEKAELIRLLEERAKRTKIFIGTVIGFVCPKTKKLESAYNLVDGQWTKTSKEPTAWFAKILSPMFLNPKRFIILIGGRGLTVHFKISVPK